MEFWADVGDGNTRKTATVRALTGVGRVEANWSVRIGSVSQQGRKAIVYVKSPQEGGAKRSPAQLVTEVMKFQADTGADRLILPIRHDAISSYPDAATYIDHFIHAAGWRCNGIAITATRAVSSLLSLHAGLAFAISAPGGTPAANEIASQLRARWLFH